MSASRQPALVEPAVLRWARESAAIEVRAVARALKVEESVVQAWEEGRQAVTLAKLKKLATLYRRPLSVFFLPEPPVGFDVLRDFRRIGGLERRMSPALALEIRRANERREAALDLASALGEPIDRSVVTATLQETASMVAGRIRAALSVSVATQLSWDDEYAALRAWKAAVEQLGILVFQTVKLPVNEARGFSLVHDQLPVVVLNAADAPHGRIFTLMHELAHIALREGGVCDLHEDGAGEIQRIETYCNRVAGEVLLPRASLLAAYRTVIATPDTSLDSAIQNLSRRYRVSAEVVLRALALYGAVSAREYEVRREAFLQSGKERKTRTARADIARRALNWGGYRFARLAFSALDDDVIDISEATDYFGVKTKQLARVRRELERVESGLSA